MSYNHCSLWPRSTSGDVVWNPWDCYSCAQVFDLLTLCPQGPRCLTPFPSASCRASLWPSRALWCRVPPPRCTLHPRSQPLCCVFPPTRPCQVSIMPPRCAPEPGRLCCSDIVCKGPDLVSCFGSESSINENVAVRGSCKMTRFAAQLVHVRRQTCKPAKRLFTKILDKKSINPRTFCWCFSRLISKKRGWSYQLDVFFSSRNVSTPSSSFFQSDGSWHSCLTGQLLGRCRH